MAKRKKQTGTLSTLLEFIDVADAALERVTGRSIASWLKELQSQSTPQVEGQKPPQIRTSQSLNDPYLVLGLPSDATIDQVKARYRQLARVFHPDKEGGYGEAMKKVNAAYHEILKERGVKA